MENKEGRENQKIFYEPIKKWLESHGFKTLVTGIKPKLVIPIGDILPTKVYSIPDIVGVKDNQVAIVEVETDLEKIFEAQLSHS